MSSKRIESNQRHRAHIATEYFQPCRGQLIFFRAFFIPFLGVRMITNTLLYIIFLDRELLELPVITVLHKTDMMGRWESQHNCIAYSIY